MFCSKRCVVAPLRETFFLHPHRAAVESGKDFFSRNGATTQRKSGSDGYYLAVEIACMCWAITGFGNMWSRAGRQRRL